MKRIILFLLLLAAFRAPAQQLTAAEYYFDTDPGVGNGTAISVAPGVTLNQSLSVSTTGLVPGVHWLYVRSAITVSPDSVRWSHAEPRRIVITGSIDAAEYFVDTDPGVGNGTAIAITPGATLNENLTIPTTGLAAGKHLLFVRTHGAAGWSLYETRAFYINDIITAAEYFIDTDPGNGLGTPVSVTPGGSIDVSLSIPAGALPAGQHRFYVRSQNSNGQWSFVETRTFYVQEQIVQAEYYFDTDPGQGAGTAIPVTTATSLDETVNLPVGGLSGGAHDLFVRTRSNSGAWAIVEKRRFYVKPIVVSGEFFVKTDPGPGNGYPLTFTPAENVNAASSLLLPPCIDTGSQLLSIRTRDEYGQWGQAEAMTIRVPLLNQGIVEQTLTNNTLYCREGAKYSFYEPGTSRVVARATTAGTLTNIVTNVWVEPAPFTAQGRSFMARHFLLQANNAGGQPVTVRLYFSDAEWEEMKAYTPQIADLSNLAVFQYEGPTEDNVLNISDATYQATINPSDWGSELGGHWVEFTITHFSEFWIMHNNGYVLPAVGLRLEGDPAAAGNELRWQTITQANTSHFIVERSADGREWTGIYRENAAGESSVLLRYRHTDRGAGDRAWYYRIRLVDRDARSTFSNTILLRRTGTISWRVAPNPVRDAAFVTGPATSGTLAWKLVDAGGHTVGAGQWTAVPGGAYPLPVRHLAAGAYRLLVQCADGLQVLPFVKE